MGLVRMLPFLAAAMFAGSPALAIDMENPDTVPTRAKLFVSCGGDSATDSETQPSLTCAGQNSVASVVKSGDKGAAVNAYAANPGGASGELYSAYAGLTYSFVIWGGYVGDKVPLKIDFVLTQDSSEAYLGARALADIQIFSPQGNLIAVRAICNLGCAGSGGDANEYAGTLNVPTLAGSQYTVKMYAEARAVAWGINTFATASVDPYIYVDPAFADAAKYSVAVSEGVANDIPAAAAVPELANWIMMIAGFGLTGGALRRGRRASLSPAWAC